MSESEMELKTQYAIEAALSKDWQKALKLNKEIIKKSPDNVETLNRLARTYFELGELAKAKTNYSKVLKIDSYNSIAEKNLAKLSTIKDRDIKNKSNSQLGGEVEPGTFIEEPGKTKILVLLDLASPSVLARLKTGEIVKLNPQKNEVLVYSQDDTKLGQVEPNIAINLSKALEEGSEFTAIIKSVQVTSSSQYSVSIFVKETYRSPKVPQSIFPNSSNHFTSFVREEALNVLSDTQTIAEEESDEDESTEELEHKMDSGDILKPDSVESLAAKEIEDDKDVDDEEN